uniref:NADH dehydrogenase subunit 1 n=1 Tax=Conlopa bredoni TaxID=3112144 RepID=UPI002E76E306|nr:NADH dehydrogenase subunit 1 [Conlopa bredoni]WRK21439.1 NADH dehydrogenase subunit 1 [Conlopa bredoni]
MYFMTFFILVVCVLVSVGFFTLLERKVLSYSQIRKGPNKVGYFGILQPFSDGLKLFMKEYLFPYNSNFIVFYICPVFGIFYSMFIWCMFPFYVNCQMFNYGFLFFLCCSSISVYVIMICGWCSNSTYSYLGCIRSVSQSISYEVSLSLILLLFFFLCDSYNFFDLWIYQKFSWFCFISFPMFFCWLVCCFAETNRAPFDFSEGESELVSGFNVEYGSSGFAFLFISEYSSIIFMSMFTCLLFLGGDFFSFKFILSILFMCYLFIWVRCSFPRYRYDKLMYLSWKCYLPMCFNFFFFFIFLKFFYFYHFFL